MSLTKPEPNAEPVEAPSRALWQLDAKPDFITNSARSWQQVAAAATAADAEVSDASAALLAGWKGNAAAAYDQQRGELTKSLTAVSTVSDAIGGALLEVADLLRRSQAELDASWTRLHAAALTFGSVRAETTVAQYIRLKTRVRLQAVAAEVRVQRSRLWVHEVAAGMNGAETLWSTAPELASGGRVIVDGQRVIVSGSGAGDDIEVGVLPYGGQQYVTVNGVRQIFPADAQIIVRAGAGGDTVRLLTPSSAGSPRVTVLGGAGRDTIDGSDRSETILGQWDEDRILGRAGDDLIYGGSEDDYITGGAGDDWVDGGVGQDTIYGLDGQDQLYGGHDRDFVDGGRDHDVVFGGRGDDLLFGGAGMDGLWGEDGNDVMLTGSTDDNGFQLADGGTGYDSARVLPGDVAYTESVTRADMTPLGDAVVADPAADPEFQARVDSDLEALNSTESGGSLLASLQQSHDAHGDSVVIGHTDWYPRELGWPADDQPVRTTVEYDPTFRPTDPAGQPVPTVVVLQHELAHAYDDFNDTSDRWGDNVERQAIGLAIDDDGLPWTSNRVDPDHPYVYTENALRDELGLPRRTRVQP